MPGHTGAVSSSESPVPAGLRPAEEDAARRETGDVEQRSVPPALPVDSDGAVHLGADVHGLLLDIDGVLSDHRTAADAAVFSWASALPGWSLAPAETAELWERLDRKHFLRYQHGELTFNGQLLARVRDFVPGGADLDDAGAQARIDEYYDHYRARLVPYEDVAGFIARLRDAVARRADAGERLAVAYVTNGDEDSQRTKLDAVGALVGDWPLIASAQAGASKPDPRIFALACERLGTGAGETVMVGDDPWSDVDGATGAGLRSVHLRRSASAPGRPVATIGTLARLVID